MHPPDPKRVLTRTARPLRFGAAIVIASMGLVACSGGASSEPATDGWKQLEGERVTVEYPEDWTTGEGSGEKWVLAARTDGASIQVADPFDDSRTAAGAIGALQWPATLNLDGYEPGDLRDITVDGADTALIQTFTYEDGGTPAQGAWIIASQRQPSATVAITIAGVNADDELISHVRETLTYEHSGTPVPDEEP